MALRKIQEINGPVFTAKIYRDSEWKEYRVKFFKDNKHFTEGDYRTPDKQDAIQMAQCGAAEVF